MGVNETVCGNEDGDMKRSRRRSAADTEERVEEALDFALERELTDEGAPAAAVVVTAVVVPFAKHHVAQRN